MERVKPACRGADYGTDQSADVHGPHDFFRHAYDVWSAYPGWTGQEAGATELADQLDRVAREHSWPRTMPPGIRLECHPLVPHVLEQLFIPSYGEFVTSLADAQLGAPGIAHWVKPQIPVLVTPGMERGQWRITADVGLIAEGTVHDG